MSLIKEESYMNVEYDENYINCSSERSRALNARTTYIDDEEDSHDSSNAESCFAEIGKNGKQVLNDKQIFKLIKEYKIHPCLWQKNHDDNKKPLKKSQALDDIADVLNVSSDVVKDKIRTLRVVFFQNVKKQTEIEKQRGPGCHYRPRWKFYEALYFLRRTGNENGDDSTMDVPQKIKKHSPGQTKSLSPETIDPIINENISYVQNEGTDESILDNEDDQQTFEGSQNSRLYSNAHKEFGDYVSLTLSQIHDERILKRAKCQIQLILSAAITGSAKQQLLTLSTMNHSK